MFDLVVVPDGGDPYPLGVGSRDVLVFEKTARKGTNLATWREAPSMVDLYRVSHIAAVRQGLFTGDLAAWEHTVDIDFADDDDEDGDGPDPTRPGRTAES